MSLIVKICGIKTAAALDAALGAGADMVGFVSFPPSPRHVEGEALRVLGAQVKGRATKVLLTVDADDDALDVAIFTARPDMLQLHGSEPPARVGAIKERYGLPVMKAIAVASADDLKAVDAYRGLADKILFDARAPKDATRPGGLGKAFDWTLLANVKPGLDYMLSGGLTPDNVGEALRITHAPGVDVSSGVERAPGDKDADLIRSFIRNARDAATKISPSPLAKQA